MSAGLSFPRNFDNISGFFSLLENIDESIKIMEFQSIEYFLFEQTVV